MAEKDVVTKVEGDEVLTKAVFLAEPKRLYPGFILYTVDQRSGSVVRVLHEGAVVGTNYEDAVEEVKMAFHDDIKKARSNGEKVRTYCSCSNGLS